MQRDSMLTDETTDRFLRMALAEDVGAGDVTSALTIPADAVTAMAFAARGKLVSCGLPLVARLYGLLDGGVRCEMLAAEGEEPVPGARLMTVRGTARVILAGERTALNLLQHLSGIATLTRRFADAAHGTGATIMDTRKTLPGLRALEKYAVRTGGGVNHRMGLYDGILIKDNHIAIAGGVAEAVRRARAGAPAGMAVEVECDTLAQVKEALTAGADVILLDNMNLADIRAAVALAKGRALLEASGGMTLENVRAIAKTGVDRISVGALTHSAPAADIGLDIAPDIL